MDANAIIQLRQYNVNEINYKINNEFDFTSTQMVNIRPRFKKSIRKIDNNNFIALLNINIADQETEKVPFHLSITISGVFCMEEWEKDNNKNITETNTIAILFPYLRTLVSTVTGSGGMPPYVLPILNINSLFNEKI